MEDCIVFSASVKVEKKYLFNKIFNFGKREHSFKKGAYVGALRNISQKLFFRK